MECDFCKSSNRIMYDAKTKQGLWATMCEKHFKAYGVKLGVGFGQEYKHEQTRGYIKIRG